VIPLGARRRDHATPAAASATPETMVVSSMAQDTNLRSLRSDDLRSRETAPAGTGRNNDPLAELARLIGQNDPFADLDRQNVRGARPQTSQHAAPPQAAPEWLARTREPAPYEGQGRRGGYQAQPQEYEEQGYQGDGQYTDAAYQDYHGAYAPDGTEESAYEDGGAYYDENQLPPQGEEGYEEAPAKRRSGLTTIAALVALAVLGTGSVYAYRTWLGPTGGGEPPVIKAEQTPSKIVPAATSSDSQPNKQAYERLGDRGGERVVPREEQPLDVRAAARPAPTISAAAVPGTTGSILPPAAPAQAAPAGGGEPKKVKTVPIRPEQSAGNATQAPPPAPRSLSAAPPSLGTPAPAPTRVATVPVQPVAPRPAATPSEGRTYAVQVASQLSEADAQASFKALQQKYPSVLGGRQASIRRAELGSKVYYQVHVGPFASADQAIELCTSLKAAGGQCFVPRN